ncbi:MAG TPA: 23S rRNA (pseudouridine(1915)-N(3))-methyltransferase RlmH [Candidatus Izemoplasmatales bacterium]|nr:23S rRNA (pseudouridine(1915)-N(3))-methyltransferase RlmH [Candidatus Izemoplasmatales bacterium]
MKIKILAVGKIKERYLQEGINDYGKRLSHYVTLEFIEVKDLKAPENLSVSDKEIIKNKEGENLLKRIGNEYVIALCIDGQEHDSISLANKIQDIFNNNSSDITFVIGGSLGLSDEVIKRANEAISFSKMTFPHQLMRLILLEQLYRAFKINNNEPYHK